MTGQAWPAYADARIDRTTLMPSIRSRTPMMLARRLGFAQLADPGRFASLSLLSGDASVLAEYQQHSQLLSGTAKNATDMAN